MLPPLDIETTALAQLKATVKQQFTNESEAYIRKKRVDDLIGVIEHNYQEKKYVKIKKIINTLFQKYTDTLPHEQQTLQQQEQALHKLIEKIKETEGIYPNERSIRDFVFDDKPNRSKLKNFLAICYGDATNFEDYCQTIKENIANQVIENEQIIQVTTENLTENPKEISNSIPQKAPQEESNKKNQEVSSFTKNNLPKIPSKWLVVGILAFFLLVFGVYITMIVVEKYNYVTSLVATTVQPDTMVMVGRKSAPLPEVPNSQEVIVKNTDSLPIKQASPNPKFRLVKQPAVSSVEKEKINSSQTSAKDTTVANPFYLSDNEVIANIDSVSLFIENVSEEKQANGLYKVIFTIKNSSPTAFVLTACDLRVSRERSSVAKTKIVDINDNLIKTVSSWVVQIPDDVGTFSYKYPMHKRLYRQIGAGEVTHLEVVFYQTDAEGQAKNPDGYGIIATIWAGTRAKLTTKSFKFKNGKFLYGK